MPANAPETELRRLVASLLVVRASGHLADGQRRHPLWEHDNDSLRALLSAGVGGVILLGGAAAELRLRTRQLASWSDQPLLLCADVEEGVGQRFAGASWLPPPLGVGRIHGRDADAASQLAERYGRCTGREARALGLNWVLGPVCDVNNNPANPVINVRAWGEQPAVVAELAAAFIAGVQGEGVLACAKHFPGHGDTAADSHLDLPVLPHSRERLDAIELPPFRRAIACGVASLMTAHLLLPELDPERPATLSPHVLTQLLRHDLGFEGLVVTDALVMEAIAARHGPGEAAVLALEAGADLVLMSADPWQAIAAIVAAVQGGRLSVERLRLSLERRRRALARTWADPDPGGLHPDRPLGFLTNGPAADDLALADDLLSRTLESQGGAVVWPHPGQGLALSRVDDLLACPFLSPAAPAIALPLKAGFHSRVLDRHDLLIAPGEREIGALPPWERAGWSEGPVLLQLFVRGNPFRGSAAGGEPWGDWIAELLRQQRLAGLVVYGSPYLWQSLRERLPVHLPAAWSPGQMPRAQELALARIGLAPREHPRLAADGGFTD
ncbi:MAG: glycoside hydrolase family 3 N-terminal domain-containing protein [Cyanobacteriota bacterium]|nr:glycoside hydrolase family 3 N-terminal domain-containing protein [Cyanobacteriota bacterium]